MLDSSTTNVFTGLLGSVRLPGVAVGTWEVMPLEATPATLIEERTLAAPKNVAYDMSISLLECLHGNYLNSLGPYA